MCFPLRSWLCWCLLLQSRTENNETHKKFFIEGLRSSRKKMLPNRPTSPVGLVTLLFGFPKKFTEQRQWYGDSTSHVWVKLLSRAGVGRSTKYLDKTSSVQYHWHRSTVAFRRRRAYVMNAHQVRYLKMINRRIVFFYERTDCMERGEAVRQKALTRLLDDRRLSRMM